MATISKRGDFQYQAIIRCKGFPSQTRKEAAKWAQDVESKVDQCLFRDRREVVQTTLFDALDR